jgi:hypothetical protein
MSDARDREIAVETKDLSWSEALIAEAARPAIAEGKEGDRQPRDLQEEP